MRTATLNLTAADLQTLIRLPEGFGLAARESGLAIGLEADGAGGVNVTATADSIPRQVESWHRESAQSAVRESRDEEEERHEPRTFPWPPAWMFLAASLLIAWLAKKLSGKS